MEVHHGSCVWQDSIGNTVKVGSVGPLLDEWSTRALKGVYRTLRYRRSPQVIDLNCYHWDAWGSMIGIKRE